MELDRLVMALAVTLTVLVVLPVMLAFATRNGGPRLAWLRRHWRWFLALSSIAWLVQIAGIYQDTARGSWFGLLPSFVAFGATLAAVFFRGHEPADDSTDRRPPAAE